MKYTPRTAAGKLAIAALLSVSIMAPTVAAPSGTVWATTANTVQKNMEMDKANSEGITEHLSDMAAEVSNIRTGGTVTVAGDQQITVTRNRETGWQADQIQLLLGAGPDVSLDKDGWIQKLQNQLNESLSGFTTDEKQDSWVVKGYSKALSAIAYSEGFTDSYFDTLDNEKLADILEALYHIAIGDADYKFNQAQSDFVKNAGFPSDDVRELLIAVFKSDEDTEGLAQEFEKYEDDKALLAADDDNADNDAIYRAILIKKKEAEANWTAAQAATSVVDKQTYADAAHAAAVAAEKYLKKLKDPDEDLTKKAETAVGEAFAAATFAYKDTADTYPDTERVKKLTALNTAKGDMKTAEGYGYVFDSDFKESLLKGLAENANTSASHAELAQFYQQEAEKYLDEARKATTAGDVEKTKAAAAAAAEAAKKAAEAAENAGADGVRTRSEADIEKAQTAANAAQAAATTAEKQIDIAQQVADAATADDNAQTASDEATDAAGHVTAAEKWKDAAKAHGNAVTAALENGDYGTAESEAKKATTAAKNAQAEFDKVMADSDATEQQKTAAKKAAEDAWDAAIGAWQAIVNDPNAPAELKNTAQDELNKAKAEKDKVTNTEVSTGTPEKPEKPSTGGTGDGEQDSEKE
ncbi:MAG: hypothetical protein Q3976_10330, partial [Corynebacterium sp.]|nr:hypothetical protein [Corynebacterium sp.]